MALQDLSRFNPERLEVEVKPIPPLPEGLSWVVALDPSLKNTGIVVKTKAGMHATTIRPESHGSGSDLLMAQALQIFDGVKAILGVYDLGGEGIAVYEKPPVGGGRLRSTESALMAGEAIRIAAHTLGVEAISIPAQTSKKVICGNANAKKTEAHAALAKGWDVPDIVTNEHQRDALMALITYLEDLA